MPDEIFVSAGKETWEASVVSGTARYVRADKPVPTDDDCRREFDEWYSQGNARCRSIYRNEIGEYPLIQTSVAWNTWQAAWKRRGDV